MRTRNKKISARNKTILAIVVMAILLFVSFGFSDDKELRKEVVEQITDTVADMVAENESTIEIPELSEADEQTVEVQETEAEGFEEQGQVAYEGSDKTPDVNVGDYAGLTYYNQLDSRWSSRMYSSIGDTSQTIGSSGCRTN